ncbi:MAG: hypothetical protein V2A64_01285 [Candidatus Omnitrophota bacterium]
MCSPKPPPDLLRKSKRLGLRKSPKIGNTCLPAGRESYRRRRFSWKRWWYDCFDEESRGNRFK